MDRLFFHIDQITRQRRRGELETALVSALCELLAAEAVELYKLFHPAGDLLVGLAASATAKETRALDDGISWPVDTGSIERHPSLHACLKENRRIAGRDVGGLHEIVQTTHQDSQPFGFVRVLTQQPLPDASLTLVDGLLTVFRNCLALLDYTESDTLTGLLNRKIFDESLITILSLVAADDSQSRALHLPRRRQMRASHPHWLGVIDIDHFKSINDNHGHLIGDEVLILVANQMKANFREQDKLFRFGGEEFVVLLMPTGPEQAHEAFERYRSTVENFDFPQVGRVTVSIGFTSIGLHDTPSIILDNADEALYYAKEHGRNQLHCYEELIKSGKIVRQKLAHTEVEFF
jgi:diguanylate cyclase (GGDEF)-like protein